MRRRPVIAVVAFLATTTAGCGADREITAASTAETTSPTTAEPTPAANLAYLDVADDYAAASQALVVRGREVVGRIVAGDIASVYEQSSPEAKAAVSLAELERGFADLQAKGGPIGARLEERVIPFTGTRGVYLSDHALGAGRLRIQIGFDPSGLSPKLEPVRPLPPDPRGDRPAKARLRLPFDGLWWATVAPTPELGNHHIVARDQRHAFDFVIWRDGTTHRGAGKINSDYWAWGQPVVAPAAGRVVAVRDGLADNRPGVETNTDDPGGNHIVIDLGNGEYAVLAHFQKGSVRVRLGDSVSAGQAMGLTGNSGNSSEPHLHFHLQDTPKFDPGGPTGIPVQFDRYEADGTAHERGTPTGGQFVKHLAGQS